MSRTAPRGAPLQRGFTGRRAGRVCSTCYDDSVTTRGARHLSAEDWLLRASQAEDSLARAKYATRGLAKPALEPTIQGLLLRQLYMAHLELERFDQAIDIAQQVVDLQALDDVAHQDLARAYLANKQYDAALGQVRLARRVAPPERKAFHDWTQGSMLYLLGRLTQAIPVFERGLRWSVGERPLIEAQLALTQVSRLPLIAASGTSAALVRMRS